METADGNLNFELNKNVFNIFKQFMARVSEFEELVAVGSKLLTGFQQGLEFLRRPPIDKTSELVKKITNANKTKHLESYLVAGCINTHDSVQNISNLQTCHAGLLDYSSKGRIILNQLESLVDDVNGTLRTALVNLPTFCDTTVEEAIAKDEEEVVTSYFSEKKNEASDFALLMAIICHMVKQDYTMQEKIISALNLKSSSGELESYCLMWSLRPFVNDGIMDHAWKLIP